MEKSFSESDGVAALSALYTAERADGSAIFATSIQVFASMLLVAGIIAGLLPTRFLDEHPYVALCIPGVAWGLACYTVIINALMTVRVKSIDALERELFKVVANGAGVKFPHLMASDVGDWVSRVSRQSRATWAANMIAFLSALLSVVGASVFVVVVTEGAVPTVVTVAFSVLYAALLALVVRGYVYSFFGELEDEWLQTEFKL